VRMLSRGDESASGCDRRPLTSIAGSCQCPDAPPACKDLVNRKLRSRRPLAGSGADSARIHSAGRRGPLARRSPAMKRAAFETLRALRDRAAASSVRWADIPVLMQTIGQQRLAANVGAARRFSAPGSESDAEMLFSIRAGASGPHSRHHRVSRAGKCLCVKWWALQDSNL
jgi:hypothetical protein